LKLVDAPNDTAKEFSWLPEGLEQVALRLARADACAFRIGDLASRWSLAGPLGFEQVRQGDQVQMVVKSVRPVPVEASLLFSEAVNHLRAAVDNVVWHIVEQEHGDLNGTVATLVSMPIARSPEDFDRWTARRVKGKMAVFALTAPLGRRLRALQPFADSRSAVPSMGRTLAALTGQEVESAHPLLLLQGYSNADKHRSIRLAAARTFSSTDTTPLLMQDLRHREVRAGDAVGPPTLWGHASLVETNTAMMVQRPEPFSAWVNPVKELNAMRQHVSWTVVPRLLTGLEMPNALPPSVDMGDNGRTDRERLADGGWNDAEARLAPLVQARLTEAEGRPAQIARVAEDSGVRLQGGGS
jgi:hypothetical protein